MPPCNEDGHFFWRTGLFLPRAGCIKWCFQLVLGLKIIVFMSKQALLFFHFPLESEELGLERSQLCS